VKRLWSHSVELLAPGIPAVRVVRRHERFELTLQVVPYLDCDAPPVEVVLIVDEHLRDTFCSRRRWAAPECTTTPRSSTTARIDC